MQTEKLTDQSLMPFGQYKGQKLANVPADHLLWLFRNERAGRLSAYIKENMDALIKKSTKKEKKR